MPKLDYLSILKFSGLHLCRCEGNVDSYGEGGKSVPEVLAGAALATWPCLVNLTDQQVPGGYLC